MSLYENYNFMTKTISNNNITIFKVLFFKYLKLYNQSKKYLIISQGLYYVIIRIAHL